MGLLHYVSIDIEISWYNARVDHRDTAVMFKALGDPTRLRIFSFLQSCCCAIAVEDSGDVRPVDGPTVGEVCCQVLGTEKISSTLSFHLKELRNAGLITMEKRGKNMICSINPEAAAELARFLRPTSTSGDNHHVDSIHRLK